MAASGIKLHANPLGLPIGSQTYPHLACIQSADLAGLVKHMKAIGIEAAVHSELKPSGISARTHVGEEDADAVLV